MKIRAIVGGSVLFAIFFALALVGALIAMENGVTQRYATGMASSSLLAAFFPCFKYGDEFASWSLNAASGGLSTFKTSAQRAWFLVMLVGLAATAVSLIACGISTGGIDSYDLQRVLWSSDYQSIWDGQWWELLGRAGTICTVLGFIGIIGHDLVYKPIGKGLGLVFKWVRNGQ